MVLGSYSRRPNDTSGVIWSPERNIQCLLKSFRSRKCDCLFPLNHNHRIMCSLTFHTLVRAQTQNLASQVATSTVNYSSLTVIHLKYAILVISTARASVAQAFIVQASLDQAPVSKPSATDGAHETGRFQGHTGRKCFLKLQMAAILINLPRGKDRILMNLIKHKGY